MADPQESPDGKTQKTRSFGSFLLFIFILIVVLAIFGTDHINSEKALSQDQYLWSLHTGRVETQTIKGTEKGSNLIQGTHISPTTGKSEGFKVQFANVESFERVYQQLKAVREFHPIPAQNLSNAIDGRWYVPQDARLITTFTERPAELNPRSEEGDDSGPAQIAPADNRFTQLANIIEFMRDRIGNAFSLMLPQFIPLLGPSMAGLNLLNKFAGENQATALEVTRSAKGQISLLQKLRVLCT